MKKHENHKTEARRGTAARMASDRLSSFTQASSLLSTMRGE
jgi:hypothetical protein